MDLKCRTWKRALRSSRSPRYRFGLAAQDLPRATSMNIHNLAKNLSARRPTHRATAILTLVDRDPTF